MMLVCLDTTAISDVVRGKQAAGRRIEELEAGGDRVCTTTLNAYEALLGIQLHRQAGQRREMVERMERLLVGLFVAPVDLPAARGGARLMAELYGAGRPAATMDLLTAAAAANAGCEAILTRNVAQFERIGLLKVLTYGH